MSRTRIPAYRHHKSSGRAVVTLNGKDHYLGPWNSAVSRFEYDRLIQEWLDNGRKLRSAGQPTDITITELVCEFWKFAQGYYVKDEKPSGQIPGIKVALRMIRQMYGRKLVSDFGPRCLETLQQHMIGANLSRRYINDNIDRIRRMFKWGVSKELVPVQVYQALTTVPGLRKGRSDARELSPVKPVAEVTVNATLPHLPPVVADMVRVQQFTGCRPGEVRVIRPRDVDTAGDVWAYRPESHKTDHLGLDRIIFIGPRAQRVLRPYLLRDSTSYCFSPAESERKRNATRRELRTTPLNPSQANRRPNRNRKLSPGTHYTKDSYRKAIHRACERAFPAPDGLSRQERMTWINDHKWSPNQLRHSVATEVRKRYGLEASQVILGHASADVTQIYAERDYELARTIMREVG